jgi:molybdenum cofactor cytidylyltransferase
MKNLNIGGLLISAGLSQRMGDFKPLMDFNSKSFVVNITEKLLIVCDEVVVVTGYKNEKVETEIESKIQNTESKILKCVYNPSYAQGMFTSLKTGLTYLKDVDWILFHFVDQPFHSEKFYTELIAQANSSYDWIQPVHEGKEGHPLLFNQKVAGMVTESADDFQLRIIRDDPEIRKKNWECNYAAILNDFDTPEDIVKHFPK